MSQQARQDVRVRPLGRLAVRRRDRLIDLDTAQATAEDAVWAERGQPLHQCTALHQRGATGRPQQRDRFRIGRAHADLGLLAAQSEIEQDGGAILRPHGGMVRPELGHDRAPAHRGLVTRQAERQALAPAFDARAIVS